MRFPLFLDLTGKTVVIVGGGTIAARRIGTLRRFGARIVVIAPTLKARPDGLTWLQRTYAPGDLEGALLAIAATDDRAVNRQVGVDARRAGIPVSVADCEAECTFYFPAICTGQDLVAGVVSTGKPKNRVRRLLVTCSGGPFYGMTPDELKNVTKHDALCHPNWTMGPKITVDCATLMNKGLELIEAMRLYGLPLSQVEAVIHRQSIVHSLVEFCDGAVLAQLGTPDMRLPIQLALTYPDRLPSPAPDLDLLTCRPLTFDAPDEAAFPCLRLAKQAAAQGGCACAALNGANEAAVALFLEEKIGFYDIPRLVEAALAQAPGTKAPDLEAILAVDAAARQSVAVAARGIVR